MKWPEIKNLSKEQLEKHLADARSRVVDLRFKASSGALKQVHQINEAKKEIAHTLTRINQLEHNQESTNESKSE